jgi:TPR repeat protein
MTGNRTYIWLLVPIIGLLYVLGLKPIVFSVLPVGSVAPNTNPSQSKSGNKLRSNDDLVATHNKFLRLARFGDQASQLLVGRNYALGRGVVRDLDIADKWFAMAAVNDTLKLLEVGLFYETEIIDLARAADWYERGAQKGDTFAYVALGYIHINKNSVDFDPEKAREYFQRAVDSGDQNGRAGLALILEYQNDLANYAASINREVPKINNFALRSAKKDHHRE